MKFGDLHFKLFPRLLSLLKSQGNGERANETKQAEYYVKYEHHGKELTVTRNFDLIVFKFQRNIKPKLITKSD